MDSQEASWPQLLLHGGQRGVIGMPKEQTPGATSLFQPNARQLQLPQVTAQRPTSPPSLPWRPLSAQPALPFLGVSAGD